MQSIPEDDDLSFSATDNVVVTSQEAIVGKRLKRGRAKKKVMSNFSLALPRGRFKKKLF